MTKAEFLEDSDVFEEVDINEVANYAWENLKANKSSRKSLDLLDKFMSGEGANRLKTVYLYLRLVDDGVDVPRESVGAGRRETFLDAMEESLLKKIDDYEDLRWGEESEEVGRLMAEEDLVEALGEENDTELLEWAFVDTYMNYRGAKGGPEKENMTEQVTAFFEGMRDDFRLEGRLFDDGELKQYFHRIQTLPVLIALDALTASKEEYLPEGTEYSEFAKAIDNVSQMIMLLKSSRSKEFKEDLDGLGRIYYSSDELKDAELDYLTDLEFAEALDEFKGLVKDGDPRVGELIKNRVEKAHSYLASSFDVLAGMPTEGAVGQCRKFLLAYGFQAKSWAEKFHRLDYRPFRGGQQVDEDTSKLNTFKKGLGKLGIYAKTKVSGKSDLIDKWILGSLVDWRIGDLPEKDKYEGPVELYG